MSKLGRDRPRLAHGDRRAHLQEHDGDVEPVADARSGAVHGDDAAEAQQADVVVDGGAAGAVDDDVKEAASQVDQLAVPAR